MKVTGGKKLSRQLGRLPVHIRKHVSDAVKKSTEEGAKIARTLAPEDSGQTKSDIRTEYKDQGMTGIVVAIETSAPKAKKDRAYSIEHGRKKGASGTTEGSHHIWRTRQYMAKRVTARMKRAVNKAAKEAFSG